MAALEGTADVPRLLLTEVSVHSHLNGKDVGETLLPQPESQVVSGSRGICVFLHIFTRLL